ncbi:MAG: hypothetical protein ACR2P6_11490 [Gammaproteobacteria bacterium]
MVELREKIAAERGRLKQVRQALSVAVQQGAQGAESYVPFYLAVAEYIDAAMDRLHIQDIRMGDMLREKADLSAPDAQQAMAELDQRLAGNQDHLQRFLAAKKELAANGVDAIDDFEAVSRAYTDYITSNMGHHSGSTDLAREHFSEDDWTYMAKISTEEEQREVRLFEQVFNSVPEGLELQT